MSAISRMSDKPQEPMSDEREREIRERAEKATPGPWEINRGGNFTNFGAAGFVAYCEEHHNSATDLHLGETYWPWSGEESETIKARAEANAEFIVSARTDIPDLLDELGRLRSVNQRLHDLVRQQRMELFSADLISENEYQELLSDPGAVARLATYDDLRSRLGEALDALEVLSQECQQDETWFNDSVLTAAREVLRANGRLK